MVELLPEEAFDLSRAPPPEPPRSPLPAGDLTTADPRPRQGPLSPGDDLRPPAPDDGAGAGRPAEVAWRRDASTLHARLTDGAQVYRPARERNAREASSRQALRQEPRVGIGDSSRTTKPRDRDPAIPDLTLPTESDDSEPEAAPAPVLVAARDPGDAPERGQGPLETDRGAKSFDAMRTGEAREVVSNRAASPEGSPGIVDFSAPAAAKAVGVVGQGPGNAPGVVNDRRPGVAPNVAGGKPSPLESSGAGSDERLYFREYQEIRQRVARALRFPRRLAIMLEQGEAIVMFKVERNGRVSGEVKLVKSAGFEEFDREAVDVVRRAAPFPTLPKALLIPVRIGFENPMIQ